MGKGVNYGWKTRDGMKAARFALRDAVARKVQSYASSAAHLDRFSRFWEWARERYGVRRLEHVKREHVQEYGRELAERVQRGEMAASTAQNAVSSVNTVLGIASRGRWESVSPTKECGIASRSTVRTDPVPERGQVERAISAIKDPVVQACARAMSALGLRAKEAGLLDPARALREAERTGRITIERGTKGGRARSVPATPEAKAALRSLSDALRGRENAVSAFGGTKGYRGALNAARGALRAAGVPRFHDLRAAYAAKRYEALTGRKPPCNGGGKASVPGQGLGDREAREVIALELGHGRIDVVAEYVGGR